MQSGKCETKESMEAAVTVVPGVPLGNDAGSGAVKPWERWLRIGRSLSSSSSRGSARAVSSRARLSWVENSVATRESLSELGT